MTSERVGITGASGYIGTALTSALKQAGFDVVATSKRDEGDTVTLDVRDIEEVATVFDGVDVVLHCAGVVGSRACSQSPDRAFSVNSNGTGNVAWFCEQQGIPLVVTSTVAAASHQNPVGASTERRPEDVYGLTKWLAEREVLALSQSSFTAHVHRFANVYGDAASSRDTRSTVHSFIQMALSEDRIRVHRPGTQARDFIHLSDVVRAVKLSVLSVLDSKETGPTVVPIGTGSATTIQNLGAITAEIASQHGLETSMELADAPDDGGPDLMTSEVDTGIAQRELGFTADRRLEESVREMISERY